MIRRVVRIIFWLFLAGFLLSLGLVVSLKWFNPPTSAFMLWERVGGEHKPNPQWVSLQHISPHLQIAVIAAEDQKFPAHWGFDFESIADALNAKDGSRRGASTITQQVAKNLFLWNGRSYVRKGIEAYLAALMELFWSKQRILEVYLNIAEFGPGVYGAEAASRTFYGQSAATLTAYQSAVLAAVLPNPKRMSAVRPSGYVHGRAWEILTVTQELGGIQYLAGM